MKPILKSGSRQLVFIMGARKIFGRKKMISIPTVKVLKQFNN